MAVAEEDRRSSSGSSSKAVPLDLQAEVHTRADRITARDAAGAGRPRPRARVAGRAVTLALDPVRRPSAVAAGWLAPMAGVARRPGAVDRRRPRRLGDGMVVTPAEAVRPIVGDTRDALLAGDGADAVGGARGLLIGSLARVPRRAARRHRAAAAAGITRLAAVANAAPWVAVAPCLLVVLGRDRGPVAVAAFAVFFFVFVGATVGLGGRPPQRPRRALRARRAAGRSRSARVQLPGCWPSLVDGLKLAAPAALAGAIFGEWYGADRGLGVLLLGGMQSGRAERLWAASLLSAACGLAAFAVLAQRPRAARRSLRGVDRADRRAGGGAAHRSAAASWSCHRSRLAAVLVSALVALDRRRATSRRWSCRARRGCGATSSTRRGDYLAAAGATLTTAAIAFVSASSSGGRRRARRADAAPRRRHRAGGRGARGDAARGAVPAVRPHLRLPAVDRAVPRGA